jgi:uncharacterized protein
MVKAQRIFTGFLISFFPAVLLAFHFRIFQVVFAAMIIQMISIVFLSSENSRMLVWCLNAFLCSYLLVLYGYRVIENFNLPIKIILLIGECLQLIPILAIYYVLKMFKQKLQLGLTTSIQALRGKKLIIATTAVLLLCILLFIKENLTFWWAFTYCFVHAIVFEILWRGLLLDLFHRFLNTYWSVLILGVAFGVYLFSFGYTLVVSSIMAVLSVGFSLIKLKTKTIIPSILLHTIIVFLLFLSGHLFIPE